MATFEAVDITVLVFAGVYVVCAWLSVALYQKKLKKHKEDLFRNMENDKPEDDDPGNSKKILCLLIWP